MIHDAVSCICTWPPLEAGYWAKQRLGLIQAGDSYVPMIWTGGSNNVGGVFWAAGNPYVDTALVDEIKISEYKSGATGHAMIGFAKQMPVCIGRCSTCANQWMSINNVCTPNQRQAYGT